MAQRKILLDSNAYFRLAQNVHPLLFVVFGDDDCCLYVIDDFQKELERSPRLISKFSWALEAVYAENRVHPIQVSRQQKEQIDETCEYIWNSCLTLGISPVDARAVATAEVLQIMLVSDDMGVQKTAQEFDVTCISTIFLLHIMHERHHITWEQVVQTVENIQYNHDECAAFKEEFERLFQKDYPQWQED